MKPEDRVIAQKYEDPSVNWADGVDQRVVQYEPDPEEWPEARRLFYFAPDNGENTRRESDEDERSTVDECGLASEFGGTFINTQRKDN